MKKAVTLVKLLNDIANDTKICQNKKDTVLENILAEVLNKKTIKNAKK